MKAKYGFLALAALALSTASQAIVMPGWERPIAKAELTEHDATGHEIGIGLKKELTLNQRDEAQQPTSLTFTEERRVYCFRAPCPPIPTTTQFTILSVGRDGCGSKIYRAVAKRPIVMGIALPGHSMPVMPAATMTLMDNSERVCDDLRMGIWEVTLDQAGQHRFLFGNPEPVYTIQSGKQ